MNGTHGPRGPGADTAGGQSVAPFRGSFTFSTPGTWGSRPRLNICRRSAAQTVLAVDFLTKGFVVRASRPHDSTAINNVRPERPHHKSGGSSRKRRRRDRCIARGVSPGFTEEKVESPGGATDFMLRRDPQAPTEEHLPPLRGSARFRSSRREISRAYTSEVIATLLWGRHICRPLTC